MRGVMCPVVYRSNWETERRTKKLLVSVAGVEKSLMPALAGFLISRAAGVQKTLRRLRWEPSLSGFKDGRALLLTNPVPSSASQNTVPPCLEPVISQLGWGFERLKPQSPAWVSSLFGAIQRFGAGCPAQVDEGRVGRVEGCYPDRGECGRSVGGARCWTGGGERGQEGVKCWSCVRAARRVRLEGERVTVRRREGVTVMKRVGGRGLVT